jgi:tetratricopeptide (TPR) repeat protein
VKRLPIVLMLCALPLLAGPVDDARALMAERKYQEAVDLLTTKLDQAHSRPEALIVLTTALNAVGDYKNGVKYGKQAIGAAAYSSEAHLQYALAMRMKMQDQRMKAIFTVGPYKKELQKAIDLDPKNVEARQEQIGFLIEAPGFAGGDRDTARERITELKKIDWRQAMLMQGMLLQAEEDRAGANAVYGKMVERDPGDGEARQALAFSLQATERYTEADRHFAVLLEDDDRERALSARYQLARSRILGEYEAQQAVDYLLEYIEQLVEPVRNLPTASNAYWRLGLAYEQLDRTAEARKALEKAVSLDADNDSAKDALKALR